MCEFCEATEQVKSTFELNSHSELTLSLRHDSENNLLKLRAQIGSIGYTLPVAAKFCLFCGEPIQY